LGILLAYLFRPLKTAFKYRWLPNSVRLTLLLTLSTVGLLVGIRFVQNNIPNDKEKLEILVRLKYRFNERFEKIMGLDPVTGKGNGFYNLVSKDVNPLRASFNEYIDLNHDQRVAFEEFYAGVEGFEPVPEKFYKYYLANKKKREPAAIKAPDGVKAAAAAVDKTAKQEQSFLKTVVNILSIWFVLPIVFVCFLFDDGAIGKFILRMVPNRYFELALSVRQEVDEAIGKYLRGISTECGLVGVTMGVGLFIVGIPVKMALLIGILAGVATAIPLLGPVVGLGFGLTYALIAEDIQPILPFISLDNLAVAVLVVNLVVLALDNFVFQPVVVGNAVNLHPLVVILGIIGASMLFGMAGVLLAIPTIVVVKVVIQNTVRGLKDYRII
jgi:predicted PurR-regulated permease PerM